MNTQTSPCIAEQTEVPSFMPAKLHLDYLDGMRALAALYVLCHHAWLIEYWGVRQPTTLMYYMTGWLVFGHFAMGVFIVLSGFCLMLPVIRGDGTLRGGAKGFIMRRARRILPPYYFALALSLILAITILSNRTGTLWDYSVPVTNSGVLAHLLMIHNLHDAMQINSVMWSVAVECQIYLLFPLLVLGWAKIGGLRTTLTAILISYVAVFALRHTRLEGLTCQYIALFCLGMLACAVSFSNESVWMKLRENLHWGVAAIGLTCIIVLIVFECDKATLFENVCFVDFLVGLWTLCILVIASHPVPTLLRRLLSWQPLVFIGTFSYSIYLLHLPLLQTCWQFALQPLHLGNTTTFLLLMSVGGILAVSIAYIFFHFCERPFMQPRQGRFKINFLC